MNNRKRTALCLLGAALCVFMAFGAALALGRYPITPAALLAGDAMAVRTFIVLRLPRAVMALVGGFGLGVAGFVYQTVFRNPLASPDIIGVSSGASVGAAFAILFVSSGALSTTVCAFAGGLAAVFLSLGLAAAAPGRSKMSLVLAGIAVHALAQTLLMLLKLTADPEKELASIEYWIMGSLAAVTRSRVWFPVPVVLVCCAAIFALHRQALLLSIEEGEARLLGVRVGAMRLPAFSCGKNSFFRCRCIRFFGVVAFVFSETPCHPASFDDELAQVNAVVLGCLAELITGHGVDVGKVEDSRRKAAHHGGAIVVPHVVAQLVDVDGGHGYPFSFLIWLLKSSNWS